MKTGGSTKPHDALALGDEGAPDLLGLLPWRQRLDRGDHLHLRHLVDAPELRDRAGAIVDAQG